MFKNFHKIKYNFRHSRHFFCVKNELSNLKEFKNGLQFLDENKFSQAEEEFRECLKIFKNVNQTDSIGYLQVLKKYGETLFYSKQYDSCEKVLKANLELAQNKFQNENTPLQFPFYKNVIAFYTYTDLKKAINYVNSLVEQEENKIFKKYFIFSLGSLYLLDNNKVEAEKHIDLTEKTSDLPGLYKALNLQNKALLFQDSNKLEDTMGLYKDSLSILENNEELDSSLLKNKDILSPESKADVLISLFKNPESSLVVTNIAEKLFEQGEDYNKATAFWLKLGLAHSDKWKSPHLPRHLAIFALFYSQLGQTLYAEGLYRKAIDMYQKVKSILKLDSF